MKFMETAANRNVKLIQAVIIMPITFPFNIDNDDITSFTSSEFSGKFCKKI